MSGAHKNYPINADGSRICIRCGVLKTVKYFHPKLDKSVCYSCILKRGRERWLKNKQKKGENVFKLKTLLSDGLKECHTCNTIKSVDEFSKTKGSKNGYHSKCKSCVSEYRKQYELKNKQVINLNRRKRRKDPLRGIIFSLRARQKNLFERNKISKGYKTTAIIREWLGCSVADCKKHIEEAFLPGMSWLNRGIGIDKWQIDHKIPISITEIVDGKIIDSELNRKIWHYTNLQPLWHIDNAIKSNKYELTKELPMVREHRAAS